MKSARELNQIVLDQPKQENVGFEPAFLHFMPSDQEGGDRSVVGRAYLLGRVCV